MKQKLLTLLCVLMTTVSAMAYSFEVDGIYYNKKGSNAEVTYKDTNYNSYSGDIVIPESVTYEGVEYLVTSIGKRAFEGCSGLTSITIPNSVTSIGDDAFRECSGLNAVHINDIAAWCNIESRYVDSNPLYYAHNLYLNGEIVKDLIIPDSVTSIRNYAFSGCSGLTSVTIPESVTSIGRYAFFGCSRLTSVAIPNSVTSIGDDAFYYCSGLTSITIPDSVTSIGEYAFASCWRLTSVTIPDSVTSIGDYAFSGCSGLNAVHINDIAAWCNIEFRNVYSNPLYYAHNLYLNGEIVKDLIIPDSVTSIRNYAFNGCSGLTSVTIPNSVTSIGGAAFQDCDGLNTVTIEGTVESIDSDVFSGCTPIFHLDSPTPGVYVYNNCTIFVPQSLLTTYREAWLDHANEIVAEGFPNPVTLNVQACADESDIVRKMDALAKELGMNESDALFSVTNLKLIGSINSYDVMVLHNKLINLVELDLSEVDIVANSYQYYTGYSTKDNTISRHFLGDFDKLKSVTLPNSVTTIEGYAIDGGSAILKNLIIGSGTETIESNAFRECAVRNVVLGDGVKTIGSYAFYNCKSLTSFSTGNLTISIGDYSFKGCSSLNTVNIGDATQSIGYEAFRDNTSLQTVTMGAGMKTIGRAAFSDCTSLANLTLGENVETIGDYAFQNCSKIESIIIPEGVVNINKYAFAGCSALSDVRFSPGLKTIGQYAFQNCTSLQEAMLPTTLESIGERAFEGCSNLSNVKIPTSMSSIANYAFNADNVRSVYTWTIQPTNISQDTFAADAYSKGILYVPATAKKLYFYNTQWSKFVDIRTFDAPYKYFYLKDEDLVIDEETPRLKGGEGEEFIEGMDVDADLNVGSGLVVEGDESQDLGDVNLDSNGDDSATIIGGNSINEESGSNVNINDLKINITITKNKWYFFCFPFDIQPDMIEFEGQYVWRWYDGNERARNGFGGWKNVVGKLTAGQGYIFQGSVDGTLTLHIGKAHIGGDAKQTAVLPFASDNPANASWNFIGNPYTGYSDICDLGFSAPVTVWNGSTYVAYHPDDDKYMLHPYQAFFVQKPAESENVDFNPAYRYTLNQSTDEIFKDLIHSRHQVRAQRANASGKRHFINLELSADDVIDCTRVVFNDDRAMDYEVGCDAAKFMSDKVAQIYTLDYEGNSYSINERPSSDYVVRLGFTAPTSGTFTISASREDVEMEIYDVKTGKSAMLSAGYTFTADAGIDNDRFILRLPTHSGIDGVNASGEGDGDAEYFGIDGINRSKNAVHGVAIEKRGKATRKVIKR